MSNEPHSGNMKKQHLHYALIVFALNLLGCQSGSQQAEQEKKVTLTTEEILNESKEDLAKRMEWWTDAKFGMFIHWGPYAVPAGEYKGETVRGIAEWIMHRASIPVNEYEEYSRQFNPEKYNADEWVRIAKDAGMKYIVLTSKHHDGFCLWDSEVSTYDVMDFSPIKRDLIQELKNACDKYGVKLCFYHSIMDWHHPDAQAPHYPEYNTKEKQNPNFQSYVDNYLYPQLTELVEKYDPAVLWFDGEWIPEWTHEHGVELYTYLRKLNPELIINNRVDKGRQGMQGMNKGDEYLGDFGTPEQEILEGTSEYYWESCMTMNDSWGYKLKDDNWKSDEMLIHNLVDIVAKGGNYLLNVGPTAEGLIPGPSVERLASIGEWMEVNQEAIYKTEIFQGGYKQGEDIRFVGKDNGATLYAIALKKPGKQLVLENIQPVDGSTIQLLGSDMKLSWAMEGGNLVISHPDELPTTLEHAWVYKIKLM